MKNIIFAGLTALIAFPAAAAPARVLTMLRMDIDGDLKDDVLQVLEIPRTQLITDRVVEARLATGKTFRFGGLLAPVTYKPEGDSPCHSHVMDGNDQLLYGTALFVSLKRTDENAFIVTEAQEDFGCSFYSERSFTAELKNGAFPVREAFRLVGHHGMGGAYYAKASFDFRSRHAEEELMDRTGDDDDNGSHEWTMPETCTLKLSDLRKQQIPACAEYKKPR